MRRSNKVGLTMVETMLFFGITGLMIIGIMVGVGSSISSQRFKDSVMSMQTFLQEQYSNVSVAINSRDSSHSCSETGIDDPSGTDSNKGQSDCVILGRLITSTGSTGTKLTVNNIIGFIPDNSTSSFDDVEIFKGVIDPAHPSIKGYNTFISDIDTETYELDWGVKYVKEDGNQLNFSILIVKSPTTGVIHTFINNSSVVNNITIQSNLVTEDALKPASNLKICLINPDFTDIISARRTAISIDANTSMENGVRTLGDNSGCHS